MFCVDSSLPQVKYLVSANQKRELLKHNLRSYPMKKEKNITSQTGLNFDAEAFKAHLMQEVRDAGGAQAYYKNAGGAENVARSFFKPFYEALLQVEMEQHLGYKKHAVEGRKSGNSRNGLSNKTIRGDFGEVEIESPRDRKGSFDPLIVKKREASVGNFSDKIISLYARGMTTREIEEHLKEIYGIEVSAQFISRATERVEQDVVEWQSRPLEKLYPVVYVDGLRVAVHSGNNKGSVIKKCVYIVLGVSVTGLQEVLGLWIADNEGATFWLKVFNDLKARGLHDILILCGDGLTGLPEAVDAVFPKTDVQLCVVHQIRNATKFVSYKDRKAFCADMRPIYTAPTIDAAELALKNFSEKWVQRYPISVASWEKNWLRLTAFFKYPVELRKIVYTTNAIESLNAQLRKNTANRKVFPNDDAVFKILFLNLKNFTNKWNKRHGWDIVMNQLSLLFKDRLAIVEEEFEI
jgi:putative transposase